MKTKLLATATAALGMLFSVNAVSAATYTINIDYNLLDGTICNNGNCGASSVFGSQYIPVNLPTLYAGDVIDTTINFTRGLALTINDPGPDRQEFGVLFFSEQFRRWVCVHLLATVSASRTWRPSNSSRFRSGLGLR